MNNKKPLNPHALRDLLFLLLNTALLFGIFTQKTPTKPFIPSV